MIIPTLIEEAFGMVALEAIYFKKDIIATNSGELSYILNSTNSTIIDRKNIIDNLSIEMNKRITNKKVKNIKFDFYEYTSEYFYKKYSSIINKEL